MWHSSCYVSSCCIFSRVSQKLLNLKKKKKWKKECMHGLVVVSSMMIISYHFYIHRYTLYENKIFITYTCKIYLLHIHTVILYIRMLYTCFWRDTHTFIIYHGLMLLVASINNHFVMVCVCVCIKKLYAWLMELFSGTTSFCLLWI